MWRAFLKRERLMGGKFIIFVAIVIVTKLGSTTSFPPTFDSSPALQTKYSKGKVEMNKLYEMSQLPKIGECWKTALEDMDTSCKHLDEETHARLALKFTSCFNEMTQAAPYICENNHNFKECLRALDSNSKNTFRDFFLQTQNMCFFIQSEIWREATDRSVNELTNTASFVSRNLKDSENRQKRILESQEHSERLQTDFVKDQNTLFNVVLRFKDIFDDFRVSVEDHRLIFAEIFEKLTRTQKLVSWIQGEMSLLDMMGFYFITLIFGFIASATQRTRQARFGLVCLAIVSLAFERSLASYLDLDGNYTPDQIQQYIWYWRRIAAGFGVMILIWAAARYRDYQALNNNMLADLHGRVEVLMEFVSELSKSGVRVPKQLLHEVNPALHQERQLQIGLPEIDEDNISEASSNDTFSNYTNDSDTENLEGELADISGDIGTNTTMPPEVSKKIPLFERFFDSNRAQNYENKVNEDGSPAFSPGHTYNLRQRKTPVRENSILSQEGASMLANVIKKSKKGNLWRFGSERSQQLNTSYFSSDDEC